MAKRIQSAAIDAKQQVVKWEGLIRMSNCFYKNYL